VVCLLGAALLLPLARSTAPRLGLNDKLRLFLEALSSHDVLVVAARVFIYTHTRTGKLESLGYRVALFARSYV